MLTVISFSELQKLYRNNVLTKSDSFDFLNQTAQNFLGEVYAEDGENMAEIIYLVSLDGQKITAVEQDILAEEDSPLLQHLPQLDEEQIILLANHQGQVITFSSATMEEFDEAGLVDESEREYYQELLTEGADVAEAGAVYAVSTQLKIEDVVGIMYPPELEDKVAELRAANEERNVSFKSTSLFE